MGRNTRYRAAGIAVACISAFGALGSVSPAMASSAPAAFDCDYWESADAQVGYARCFDLPTGFNVFRAKVTCSGLGGTRVIYGDWVRKRATSYARCSSNGSAGVVHVTATADIAT